MIAYFDRHVHTNSIKIIWDFKLMQFSIAFLRTYSWLLILCDVNDRRCRPIKCYQCNPLLALLCHSQIHILYISQKSSRKQFSIDHAFLLGSHCHQIQVLEKCHASNDYLTSINRPLFSKNSPLYGGLTIRWTCVNRLTFYFWVLKLVRKRIKQIW